MKGYVIYDPATGEILSTTVISEDAQLGEGDGEGIAYPLPTGESYVLLDEEDDTEISDEFYKVDLTTLEIEPKTYITSTTSITAAENALATITGLPDCTATFSDGTSLEIADGELSVSCDLEGEQMVYLTSPIYLPTTVTFTVTE